MGFTVIPLFYDQVVLFLSNISVFIEDISSKYELNLGVLQTSISEISSNIIKNALYNPRPGMESGVSAKGTFGAETVILSPTWRGDTDRRCQAE